MSWRPKLNISDGLVDLMAKNPYAEAGRNIGAGLIDLGQRRVKDAKEADIEAKEEEKRTQKMMAQAAKNRALNPKASEAFLNQYGATKDSPLYSLDAPTKGNADLGLVDLGKHEAPKAWKQTKGADGDDVIYFDDGSSKKGAKFFQEKDYGHFTDKDGQYTLYNKANPKEKIVLGKTFNQAENWAKYNSSKQSNNNLKNESDETNIYLGATSPKLRKFAEEHNIPIRVERYGRGKGQERRYYLKQDFINAMRKIRSGNKTMSQDEIGGALTNGINKKVGVR